MRPIWTQAPPLHRISTFHLRDNTEFPSVLLGLPAHSTQGQPCVSCNYMCAQISISRMQRLSTPGSTRAHLCWEVWVTAVFSGRCWKTHFCVDHLRVADQGSCRETSRLAAEKNSEQEHNNSDMTPIFLYMLELSPQWLKMYWEPFSDQNTLPQLKKTQRQ